MYTRDSVHEVDQGEETGEKVTVLLNFELLKKIKKSALLRNQIINPRHLSNVLKGAKIINYISLNVIATINLNL